MCYMFRPILLKEQKIMDQSELRAHLEEGETDENENLLIYHPHCSVRCFSLSSALSISTTWMV